MSRRSAVVERPQPEPEPEHRCTSCGDRIERPYRQCVYCYAIDQEGGLW